MAVIDLLAPKLQRQNCRVFFSSSRRYLQLVFTEAALELPTCWLSSLTVENFVHRESASCCVTRVVRLLCASRFSNATSSWSAKRAMPGFLQNGDNQVLADPVNVTSLVMYMSLLLVLDECMYTYLHVWCPGNQQTLIVIIV